MMYFSITFFVQEVFKLIYSLSASGCLIIEDVTCLSSKAFRVMSSLLLTSPLSALVIPAKIAHGTATQVHKLWDHISTAHIHLSLNVLGEKLSFCKTNTIKP